MPLPRCISTYPKRINQTHSHPNRRINRAKAGSTVQRDVRRTIEVIEKEALEEDEDSIPVISPAYQIAILEMAAKIREVPVWELLKFISRKVKIA